MEPRAKKIVVIEDSPSQALEIRLYLENCGLQVQMAANGTEGLEIIQQNRPDAIVLDVELPGISGLEVCRRLKTAPSTSQIPIIMLTAHDEPDVVIRGVERGAIDYIPKDPFSARVLLETLRQLGLIDQIPTEE